MTTGPSELTSFARLRGRFVEAIADGGDANETPDFVPAQGSIVFTPELSNVTAYDSDPGLSVIPRPITVTLDGAGSFDEWFVPTNVGNPANWTYRVQFRLVGLVLPSFSIDMPAGSDRWLNEFLPVGSSTGTLTLRGPAGDAGSGSGTVTFTSYDSLADAQAAFEDGDIAAGDIILVVAP